MSVVLPWVVVVLIYNSLLLLPPFSLIPWNVRIMLSLLFTGCMLSALLIVLLVHPF